MMRKYTPITRIMIFIMFLLFFSFSFSSEIINDENHLMFLRETFKIGEEYAVGYVIYADTKAGQFVHARAPGEGITCVDDTARAGIYFLRRYDDHFNNDPEMAERYKTLALETIDFCGHFRTMEGDYYNFLFEDGQINKNGITSRPSKSWWALRALWLLSESLNIISDDEEFDKSYYYQQAVQTALLFKSELDTNGLIRGYTDISSLYVIGLANLYRYSKDNQLKAVLESVSDGIIDKQKDILFRKIIDEGQEDFNFHSWGSRQVQALAMAYEITGNKKYYQAACDMADGLYSHMINLGPLYEYNASNISLFPQIAYGTEAAVSSLYYLYQAEGEEKYAIMMALLHGFFNGNNHLSRKMVGENGEGYDGLESVFINRNAGAESTISFLLSQGLIDRIPEGFANYSLITPLKRSVPLLINIDNMNPGLSNVENRVESGMSGLAGTTFKLRDLKVISPGDYEVYLLGDRLKNGICSITISGTTVFVETGETESPIFLGTVKKTDSETDTDTKIMLTAKFQEDAFLNQLFFLPVIEYQIYSEKDSNQHRLWAFNTNGKESISFDLFGMEHEIAPLSFLFSDVSVQVQEPESKEELVFSPELIKKEDSQAIMLDLTEIYNNKGVGTPLEPGNLDNYGASKGAYYSKDALKKHLNNNILTTDFVPFLLEIETQYDNIIANGQTIQINEGGQFLYVLGSCDHGSFSGELEIGFEESKEYIQLTFPDWCDSGVSKQDVAIEMPYRFNSQDLNEWINPKLYVQKIAIEGKEIKNIILPVVPTMHIFGITLQ